MGIHGLPQSRWYSWECSASLTAWGRQYVNNLIQSAKAKGFEVIYADTDSCFIILPNNDGIAHDFARKFNKNLPEMMELNLKDSMTQESSYPRKPKPGVRRKNTRFTAKKTGCKSRDSSLSEGTHQ